jgi:hypothetical protein
MMGAKALQDVVLEADVGRIVEVFHPQDLLAAGHALLADEHAPGLLVQGEMDIRLERGDDGVDAGIQRRGLLGRAGDDKRGSGLVDENRVHLVHDGEVEVALHELFLVELHVVAQVVETELVVGAVGDVSAVGRLAFLVGQAVHDDPHGKSEIIIDVSHPGRVAPRQVVVDRDQVHALSGQGV